MRFLSAIGIRDVDVMTCKGFRKSKRSVHFVEAGKKSIDVASRMASFVSDKLSAGENLFVYYPYKRTTLDGKGSIKRFGIRDFVAEIQRQSGINDDDVQVYYGEMSDAECKETLSDVNASWSTKRLVVTTSKITVGVSFDARHFHSVG